MNKDVFFGTIPALLTPCTADLQPDFDALVRKGQEMIAAGMSGVVYCGSCGDWPLPGARTQDPADGPTERAGSWAR